jgi:hypothetical protein
LLVHTTIGLTAANTVPLKSITLENFSKPRIYSTAGEHHRHHEGTLARSGEATNSWRLGTWTLQVIDVIPTSYLPGRWVVVSCQREAYRARARAKPPTLLAVKRARAPIAITSHDAHRPVPTTCALFMTSLNPASRIFSDVHFTSWVEFKAWKRTFLIHIQYNDSATLWGLLIHRRECH